MHTAVLPSASFLRSVQCKLQVQRSLAGAVTEDKEVDTKTRRRYAQSLGTIIRPVSMSKWLIIKIK
jgi:hypothetical protein